MKTVFTAEQFTGTQWETGADKAKFANQFVRLVERGFQQSDFPKWFYSRLSNCFSHIAHYNQHGFWETWFSDTGQQIAFLDNAAQAGGYGDPTFTYSDVERALKTWLLENPQHRATLAAKLGAAIETDERRELARLQSKYATA